MMRNPNLVPLNCAAARALRCAGLLASTALALAACGRDDASRFDVAAAAEIPGNFEFSPVHPEEKTPDGRRTLRLDSLHGNLEITDVDGPVVTRKTVVKVGMHPVSVRAASNGEAWIVDPIADSISIVDLDSATVIAALQTAPQPTDVMFSGSPSRAFVTVAQGRALLVFNPLAPTEPPTRIALQSPTQRVAADDI